MADSPAAYWRLGEASGYPQDASAGNHHVTVIGGTPVYSVAGALTGDSDTAMTFDGSTEYLSAPSSPGFDLGDGPLTVECWAKRSSFAAWGAPLAKTGTNGYGIAFNPSDYFALTVSGFGAIATSSSITTDTGWHHYVATKNGSTRTIYKDGNDVTTLGTNQTVVNTGGAVELGRKAGADWFAGSLDEVAIYASVLSPARVQAHYTAATGGVGPPLVPSALIGPTTTLYQPTVTGGASGIFVTSVSAMLAALADTGNTLIVLQNGTYNSSWMDISGSVQAGYIRTAGTAVTVRAETDGGVTLNFGGSAIAMWFRNGVAYQTWQGFKFGSLVPWDNGVIAIGEGNGVPVHDITWKTVEFLDTVVAGAGPNGNYTNGQGFYFSWANSGGNYNLTVDGFVSNAAVWSPLQHYITDASGRTGCHDVIVKNVTLNLDHRAHAQMGIVFWDASIYNILYEDVTINHANEYGVRHADGGSAITLRRVTTVSSNGAGFYSEFGTPPTVTGFTFDTCTFG